MQELEGVALVTGAARRIGAAIARELHAAGFNVVLHHRASGAEARALEKELNRRRPDSALVRRADLLSLAAVEKLAEAAHARWHRLDVLVNNASSYFKTPLGAITEAQFDDLVGSNLRAPLFLTQACVRRMKTGCIVNITDIHATATMKNHAVYCAAKAGLVSLTENLARELAPRIRVNAVAPGHILWATGNTLSAPQKSAELSRVPLARLGTPEDIAAAVRYLVSPAAAYVTGAVLPVDGGLRLV